MTVAALGAAGAGAFLRARHEITPPGAPAQTGAAEAAVATPLALPARIDAIVAGGGPSPESNQVSLEQDVRLATEVLGAGTVTLFGGGPGTRSVQVADLEPRGEPLLVELGGLLAPRAGRDAHYRATSLALHGAATLTQLESMLELALAQPGPTLSVYVAGHGEAGESPVESRTLFWGGDALDAIGLAQWLDARTPARPVRFIVTSCFSGGLGEMVFEAADRTRGASAQERCGLFATSWDEEASGCDPDPVRAHHDGFGVHFLEALRGRDREGRDRLQALDLDGDGHVGPYEALTHARIASRSIDIPTTTSELYLRAVASTDEAVPLAPALATPLPEQRVVIEALLAVTGLSGEDELVRRLEDTRSRKAEHDAVIEEASAELDARYFALVAEMLSRWPVLDDPFHPDFVSTIREEHAALEHYLAGSVTVRRYTEAEEELSAMGSVDLALRLELSLLRRLEQAFETVALAAVLEARGGADWARYLALRACEWGAP